MEYDITGTIANLVREADTHFEQQMEEQAEALRRICCIDSSQGRWVEIGVEFLFSAFELEERDFAGRLPELAHLSKSARQQFAESLADHLRACDHCALKHQYELDLNVRIEQAMRGNSDFLLQELQVKMGDHIEVDLIEM